MQIFALPICFNPRLPHGRRRSSRRDAGHTGGFNPRLPHGRRPASSTCTRSVRWFQSTPPAREATSCPAIQTDCTSFNPRLPHGRRPVAVHGCVVTRQFQSTPPAREATVISFHGFSFPLFQSTPPAREATGGDHQPSTIDHVSIHASRTGGDDNDRQGDHPKQAFQSTPPAREATTVRHPRGRTSRRFNPRLPHGRRRSLPS
mgnify:CR=1 FL=1